MTYKRFINFMFLVLIFGAGYAASKYWNVPKQVKIEEQSKVLLEKVSAVAKLVTVEGTFSEVYNYKDYWGYDFFPFQKKAIILVNAKVSVGYDLQKMNIKSDAATKTILISNIPAAEILSLDHSLSYYDISEGSFNAFTAEDYTKLQSKAKDFIKEKAEKSDLKRKAQEQGNQMLDVMRFMVESAGWTFVIAQATTVPIQG